MRPGSFADRLQNTETIDGESFGDGPVHTPARLRFAAEGDTLRLKCADVTCTPAAMAALWSAMPARALPHAGLCAPPNRHTTRLPQRRK